MELNSRLVVTIAACPTNKNKWHPVDLCGAAEAGTTRPKPGEGLVSTNLGELYVVYTLYVLNSTTNKPVSTDCSSLERILQLCHLRTFCAFSGVADTSADIKVVVK